MAVKTLNSLIRLIFQKIDNPFGSLGKKGDSFRFGKINSLLLAFQCRY